MTVGSIQSGFRKTGIYPVNFGVIDKSKFTPSQVTDTVLTNVLHVFRYTLFSDLLSASSLLSFCLDQAK